MTRKQKRWLIGVGLMLGALAVAILVAASLLARRFEPFIREQAVAYLSERFKSDVEIEQLRVRLPNTSVVRLLMTRGRGALASVEGEGISLRYRGRQDVPPLFAMNKFAFDVDLGTVFDSPRRVPLVTLDGMEINVPPSGERPEMPEGSKGGTPVIIDRVIATNATLRILPKDSSKQPLTFDIAQLQLRSAGAGQNMKYEAKLTNPKPPGEIDSSGAFGPWDADDPGKTPIAGDYTFQNADLGVFNGIAGILASTGDFSGSLDSIKARGEATVPDFRLKMAGAPVPLWTRFEVLVDGTNGNTVLQPVQARLGRTNFTTSGGVIKHEGDKRRSIELDVSMPNGDIRDLLRLAVKGPPFMNGQLALKSKIAIPPLSGTVREKLILRGSFTVTKGHFLRSGIQDKIDTFSRRAQGQPKNEEIDEVISRMGGRFHMENEVIRFQDLAFAVPGADVELDGDYNLGADALDLYGTLKMQARVSQTMTGWKRWALKVADPFFAKNGAGTFLKIQVQGTSKEPKFGLDRRKDDEKSERARSKT
jgi:hypothetical protein